MREPGPEGPGVAREPLTPEARPMKNPNPSGGAGRPPHAPVGIGWRSRALVLAGAALALLFTAFSLARGTGIGFIRDVWVGAALWSFLTALSCVLWRGFHGRDWSAFSRHELPGGRGERFDWSTKTGRYDWRRDLEEQELHGHDP